MHRIFDKMTKAELKDAVTTATAKFKGIYDGEGAVNKELTDTLSKYVSPITAKAIAMAIGSCKGVRAVDEVKDRLTFVQFAAVVPLRNRNKHNYTIGEPVIMIIGEEGADNGMRGLKLNGSIDGLLPRYRRSLRPATSGEIDQVVNAMYYL